jgi:trehalose-6-phosphate synthase
LGRLVVVSNRVSVPSGDGAKRAGGLEVALRPTLQRNGGMWLGWSGKVGAVDQPETPTARERTTAGHREKRQPRMCAAISSTIRDPLSFRKGGAYKNPNE